MPKREQSKNMGRLNEDLRRELIAIIGAMKDPRLKGGLLTITRVEAAPDLSTCKVYVSVLDEAKSSNATLEAVASLERAKGHVRSEIASRMHIRRSPEFTFVADENAAYAAHINELLGKI